MTSLFSASRWGGGVSAKARGIAIGRYVKRAGAGRSPGVSRMTVKSHDPAFASDSSRPDIVVHFISGECPVLTVAADRAGQRGLWIGADKGPNEIRTTPV